MELVQSEVELVIPYNDTTEVYRYMVLFVKSWVVRNGGAREIPLTPPDLL